MRETASGLVVATGLESIPDVVKDQQAANAGRTREVWTPEEWKLFKRCAELFHRKGDKFLIRCRAELCPDPIVRLAVDPGADRGAVLRCGCTDRVFARFGAPNRSFLR